MIGNECLLGHIATLMESLGLTYDEVVHKIPFRNLQVMQRDKLHPAYGKVIHKISGKEMAARRIEKLRGGW